MINDNNFSSCKNKMFLMVYIFLLFRFSMLGIYYTCKRRRKYLLLRHYFEFTSTWNRGERKDTNKEERPTLTQEDGSTRGKSEGLAWHSGGLISPYLASGSHRALATPGAGHTFRQSRSKIFLLVRRYEKNFQKLCTLHFFTCFKENLLISNSLFLWFIWKA